MPCSTCLYFKVSSTDKGLNGFCFYPMPADDPQAPPEPIITHFNDGVGCKVFASQDEAERWLSLALLPDDHPWWDKEANNDKCNKN